MAGLSALPRSVTRRAPDDRWSIISAKNTEMNEDKCCFSCSFRVRLEGNIGKYAAGLGIYGTPTD